MRRVVGLGGIGALLLVLLLPGAESAAAPAAPDKCAACHVETGDARLEAPAKAYAEDIHQAKGFGCVACHGGNPAEEGVEAMDPAKGYIGKPDRRAIPQLCGRCHSNAAFMKRYNPGLRVDQVAEYASSVHGRRLRELGDQKVATCTSCHPAHSIRPPSDAKSSVHPLKVVETCGSCHSDAKRMAGYGIPTDQADKYRASVHWHAMTAKGDLSAPTCNDCHGNHGAVPPGVGWVGNVCGQCHAVMAERFSKSTHAKVFAELGTPGCATCHENHAIQKAGDHMLGVADKAVCASCHAADDKGGKVATEMRQWIDRLRGEVDQARGLLVHAAEAGVEVSQAQFDLNGATDALVKARAAVHGFAVAGVKSEAEPGLAIAAKARERGVRAGEELRFRRKGLGVSVMVIAVLIGGLVVKIRQMDGRRGGRVDG